MSKGHCTYNNLKIKTTAFLLLQRIVCLLCLYSSCLWSIHFCNLKSSWLLCAVVEIVLFSTVISRHCTRSCSYRIVTAGHNFPQCISGIVFVHSGEPGGRDEGSEEATSAPGHYSNISILYQGK